MMDGLLIINKPTGMTSHDVVARVRRVLKVKKVGHAGTLDPLATGVLVILIGKYTKRSAEMMGFDKGYRSTLKLGDKRDTADTEGTTLEEKPYAHITQEHMTQAFQKFEGDIEQLPPMYSAVKHKGQPLYKLARKGIEVKREPRQVHIEQINMLSFNPPYVEFEMFCSKGTYVRQLADDLGDALGCGACISQIERIKVGPFTLDEAIHLEDIHADHIRHWTNQPAA